MVGRFLFIFLQDKMKICPTETEGAHSCSPGIAVFGIKPWPGFRIQIKRRILDIQFGIGLGNVDGGRQNLMVESQSRLYNTGSACRSFGVPNLGFHTPQRNMLLPGVAFTKYICQGCKFGQIARGRPCAMSFEQPDT